MNISTLPVLHGAPAAARIACIVMALPQLAVVGLLVSWALPYHAAGIAVLLAVQLACMRRFLRDPVGRAVWYSSVGVGLYVTGMMITAFGLRNLALTGSLG